MLEPYQVIEVISSIIYAFSFYLVILVSFHAIFWCFCCPSATMISYATQPYAPPQHHLHSTNQVGSPKPGAPTPLPLSCQPKMVHAVHTENTPWTSGTGSQRWLCFWAPGALNNKRISSWLKPQKYCLNKTEIYPEPSCYHSFKTRKGSYFA